MPSRAAFAVRAVLCGVVFAASQTLGGALVSALGLKMLELPSGTDRAGVAAFTLLASPLIPLALAPVAARMAGGLLDRAARLALWFYTAFGLNTMIEARIFSTLVQPDAFAGMCVFHALPAAAAGLAVAAAFPAQGGGRAALPRRSAGEWAVRLMAAWLAFPAIYLLFGSMVAPLVVPAYEQGVAGLVLPPMKVIVPVQLLRSLLFLASAAPVLLAWSGGWKPLAWRAGWAFWVMTGLYGMLTAAWMPGLLRVANGLEIGADSFAYAWVLAWALRGPAKRGTSA
ncbi:MAG: hypothetical protein N2036_15065 [Bryobacteraceae bacterium]|nr:hypothetical protein [Bryobacteraceae bacterium]